MPQSLSRVLTHLIFSTKHRVPVLTPQIQTELYPYFAVVLRDNGCPALQVGGHLDHMHLFFGLSRTLSIAQIVEIVKTSTSKWIKTKGPPFAQFHWQGGYGTFSVSQSEAVTAIRYVANQVEHHRTITLPAEYREYLT